MQCLRGQWTITTYGNRRAAVLAAVLILGLATPARSDNPFAGDAYSVHHQLGALIDGILQCLSVHQAGMDDNTVLFDDLTESLDPFTNGTLPFVFEFESGRAPCPESSVSIITSSGSDLFPEGFVEPETGTPLDTACFEIGIDDPLDSSEPVEVISAVLEFFNVTGPMGPLDITSSFSNPWDGRLSIALPGFTGFDITSVVLTLDTAAPNSHVFSDGFETGDTASWTDESP